MIVAACLGIWTVEIGVTFNAFTTFKWITLKSGWAATSGSMIVAVAFSIHCARVLQDTWINTFSIVTLFVIAAFVVGLASQFNTTKLGISRVPGFAVANWVMIGNLAFGVWTTITWIYAKLIDTRFG